MDQYTVNGVEVSFDTFDLDCLEAYYEEAERVAEETERVPEGETELQRLRRICYAMLDAFDRMCGEGTARAVFGERVNIKAIYEGYSGFVSAVGEATGGFLPGRRSTAGGGRSGRRV